MEKERDELREALDILEAHLEAHLGTGTRQYDSEDGTRASRVKNSPMARVLRSVSRKGARNKEPKEAVDLDEEESVSERVARLITHQAGARGCSTPDSRKISCQSPRLSVKSDKSAGSDMRSGSLPKHKLKSQDPEL